MDFGESDMATQLIQSAVAAHQSRPNVFVRDVGLTDVHGSDTAPVHTPKSAMWPEFTTGTFSWMQGTWWPTILLVTVTRRTVARNEAVNGRTEVHIEYELVNMSSEHIRLVVYAVGIIVGGWLYARLTAQPRLPGSETSQFQRPSAPYKQNDHQHKTMTAQAATNNGVGAGAVRDVAIVDGMEEEGALMHSTESTILLALGAESMRRAVVRPRGGGGVAPQWLGDMGWRNDPQDTYALGYKGTLHGSKGVGTARRCCPGTCRRCILRTKQWLDARSWWGANLRVWSCSSLQAGAVVIGGLVVEHLVLMYCV